MRSQIELSNEAATELAGSGDAVLRALEGHVECDLYLRGNVVTLDGEPEAVRAAETGASSPKDLGLLMKATMAKVQGRADGKRVSALAREELGA